MVELMSRRLHQVDENQALLSDNIHTLNERCRSLQSRSDQLREDVEYLSAKCGELERHCGQLYDGQYMFDVSGQPVTWIIRWASWNLYYVVC